MKKEVSPYLSFIKAISLTIKQFKLYSTNHPIAKQSLDILQKEISDFFVKEEKITIGSLKGRLLINGGLPSDKDMTLRDLVKELDRLQIEGLVFNRGVEIEEMTQLIKLMSERSKTHEEGGGFKKRFEDKQFKHIRLSTGKFQLVEDGQVVAEEEEIGSGGGEPGEGLGSAEPITSVADIIHRLRHDPQSEATLAQPLDLDCQKVVENLETHPQEVAELALQDTQDPAHLETLIRKVVHSLVEGLISYLVEQGKDITKALEKLSKELEKSLKKIGAGDAFDELTRKIPKLFEEESDDLRVQMMVKMHQKYPEDKKAVQKMANKLFKQQAVRDRLSGVVQQKLSEAGMGAGDAAEIFHTIQDKEKRKKKKVSIDIEELETLKQKAEDAEQFAEREVKKAVEKVEREKKKIQDEKERIDAVVRNLSEGVLVVDKGGQVVMMNPAAEKLLGVNQNEKLGKHVTDGLKDEHMVAMTHGDLDDTGDQIAKNVELVSLNDETQKVLQASTAVIENENGHTVGMVSVLSDVTKQKEVEDLKGKFVANVSHELRTPLVAIQKSLAVILEEELGGVNEDQKKFLSIAHRNIDRLSRLINDLLDVSKLESGRVQLKPHPLPVGEVVRHVFMTLKTWAEDKQVSLETHFEDDNTQVEADSDKITQVLTNLIGNAIKFTPQKGAVSVDIKRVEVNGEAALEVGVCDTGIGIAPEDQKKIFNKFEQVSLAQPAGIPSTGLGLSIAKEIVELHSGSIWVESQPEQGSRFAFRLPLKFKQHEEIRSPLVP